MINFKKNKKGITLVALVITIIILLILAGISIASLTNSGLFEKAREAEAKSKNVQNEENATLSQYESIINEYLSGTGGDKESTPKEPIQMIWTMNEETGEITGEITSEVTGEVTGEVTLNVGDYVNYQAKVTNATDEQLTALNTLLNTYSGWAKNALENEALQWRVLDVENGQLRLISATPTTKTVSANEIYLMGEDGYNNAVYLIDNACKTLYNSSCASKVQNLKREDIEEHLAYDYTQYENSYVDTKKYGGTLEYASEEYKYYPNIFAKEKTGWIDGKQGTELDLSQQTEADLVIGFTQVSSKIKITQTHWEKSMTKTDFKNSIYYTLFIKDTGYWVSSRCVSAGFDKASFCVCRINSAKVTSSTLRYSVGNIRNGSSSAFRPVITLKSNVTIGEGDGKTTAYELNM